jgi:hypothetical protein
LHEEHTALSGNRRLQADDAQSHLQRQEAETKAFDFASLKPSCLTETNPLDKPPRLALSQSTFLITINTTANNHF